MLEKATTSMHKMTPVHGKAQAHGTAAFSRCDHLLDQTHPEDSQKMGSVGRARSEQSDKQLAATTTSKAKGHWQCGCYTYILGLTAVSVPHNPHHFQALCPPLCAGALCSMPAWVWRDVRSVLFPVFLFPRPCLGWQPVRCLPALLQLVDLWHTERARDAEEHRRRTQKTGNTHNQPKRPSTGTPRGPVVGGQDKS